VSSGALIANNGTLNFFEGRTSVQKVASVAITAPGYVNLNDNDLVVTGSDYGTISGLVATGRNGGAWGGVGGITSATAAANPIGSTTLGVLSGTEYLAVNGGTFGDATIVASDVVVKYTYYGDTDFTGSVDFDDYVRIDGGLNSGLTGWVNGDFDYSGGVDFDDYVLIDLAFNAQSGTLRRAQDYLDGTDRSMAGMGAPSLQVVVQHFGDFGIPYASHFLAAVPEPATVGLIGLISTAALAGRRRRA
jgi:hypothetical protein